MTKPNRKKLTRILVGIGISWIIAASILAIALSLVPAEQWNQWRTEIGQVHRNVYGSRVLSDTFGGETRGYRTPHSSMAIRKMHSTGAVLSLIFLGGLFLLVHRHRRHRWLLAKGDPDRRFENPQDTLRNRYAQGEINDQDYTSRLQTLKGKE